MHPFALVRLVLAATFLLAVSTVARAQSSPAATFSVREAAVQTLAVPGRAEPIAVQVVVGGVAVDLLLEPITLRANNFVLMVDSGAGPQPVEAPPEMNFAGSAIGRPGSSARFTVVDGSWRGVIDLGDSGPLYWVQPLKDAGGQGGAPADQHVIYAGDAVIGDGRGCPGGVEVGGGVETGTVGRPKGAPVSCVQQTQIAFDADVLFYIQNGSNTATATADINSIVNAMNLIYARDVTVSFVVTTVIVRTTAGLYTSSVPSTLLNQFQAEWNANDTAVVRDIAHLMTGQPTGGTIGLAFLGQVCSQTNGYGLSQSRYSSNFALRTSLTCHEVGHNFSATHCDGDSDCSIMCSSNGSCSGNVTSFSTRSINEIRPYAQGRSCLTPIAGFATPVAPHATADTAIGAPGGFVDIDVLANDYDGNCQTLSIQSFPASTAKGTLTRRIGAGPGGRDLIRYSALVAASGTDTWTYTLADTSAATSTANVTVTIPAPKAPDYAGATRTQLDGNYYRLQGQASVPNFTTFNFGSGNFNGSPINFTSSTGNFANSGRADNVAAVVTATLNVQTAGAWTFFTQSDEGSLLYIDNVLVVNNDFAHTSLERSGVVASLTAGNHALRVEYFELTGPCELIVKWQGPGVAKQVIPAARLNNAFSLLYYELPPPITALPSFTGLVPVASAPTANINFPSAAGNFGASGRAGDVGAAFTGLISVPSSGVYTFYLESDDGSRLTLGPSQVVVINDGVHAMTEVGGQVALLPGLHTFKVEYFSGSAPSGLIARWEGPGIVKAVIPATSLFRLPLACNAADVGGPGGVGGADGTLDNNDFIAFITYFFASSPVADLGRAGGLTPGDGAFDNNDFIAFIGYFFAPCN